MSSVVGAGGKDTSQVPTVEVVPTVADPIAEPLSTAPTTAVTIESIAPESAPPTVPVTVPTDSVMPDIVEDDQTAFDWDDCPACGMG